MTPKKFVFFIFLEWLLLATLKVEFFKYDFFANPGIEQIVFWILIAVITAAFVRRFGPISFLESFLVNFVWSFSGLLLDLLLLTPYLSLSIFASKAYWFGFVFMNIAIFLFHKKLHIHVREENHKKKHGH